MTPRPLAAGRRVAARTPLQVKLIVAVLALVAVALALIGLASVAALDRYLVGRLDTQLEVVARGAARERPPSISGPGPPRKGPPSPYLVQYRGAGGQLETEVKNPLEDGQQPPQVPDDAAWSRTGRARW
jgi:hypothetical protein